MPQRYAEIAESFMDTKAPSEINNVARRVVLPNRMEIAYQSRAEIEFFYQDIFEKQIYLKNGITLSEGDYVFDVGANIGMFSLFASQQCKGIRLYSFEPAPPLFEILSHNLVANGFNARLFNCGISNQEGTANFTFYPNSSGMSSFYADHNEEKAALRDIMLNQLQQGMTGMDRVLRYADDLLEERLKSQTYECRLRTVSEIMREEQVPRIDLMKVDVQKSELDVVAGIQEDDWPRIKQIVIEVHDINGRLRQMKELLQARGYAVVVEQDAHYRDSILYNLYAIRSPGSSHQLDSSTLKQIHDRAQKQKEASLRRKQLLAQKDKGDGR